MPGRFHLVTRGAAAALRALAQAGPLTVALCASDRSGTRRHPLSAGLREAQLRAALGEGARIVHVPDLEDDGRWVAAVRGCAPDATVYAGNHEVLALFEAAGAPTAGLPVAGDTPQELFERLARGQDVEAHVEPAAWAVVAPEVPAVRALLARPLVNDDGELGHARDFDSYGAQMDASLQAKLDDLLPWVVPGRVVDKGCGTGKLLVALSRRFPSSAFVGVDLSREFLRRCDENTYGSDDVALIAGDARDPAVPPGEASTVILSSIVHEIWSYAGYSSDAVDRALASAATELRPGGRLLIRDGVSPGAGVWRMRWLKPGVEEVFHRFAREFRGGQGAPFRDLGGGEVELSAHLANEFLCKKDYLTNWHIEVNEEFGVDTVEGWPLRLARAGLVAREVRATHNPWIVANRYVGAVALTDARGAAIPWPATNVVVVGEKP